jgi:histidine triad (HIT) family protein
VDCLFCRIAAGTEPAHIVWDTPDVMAFLDTRPVFVGHVLVITRQHIPTLLELPDELVEPLFRDVRTIAGAVVAAFNAEGTFVAMNNVVSQSVPHLHVHVVPRTKGDGLRGFFWPRRKYDDEAHLEATAEVLRSQLALSRQPD